MVTLGRLTYTRNWIDLDNPELTNPHSKYRRQRREIALTVAAERGFEVLWPYERAGVPIKASRCRAIKGGRDIAELPVTKVLLPISEWRTIWCPQIVTRGIE
jgi:hypothetical protein